MAIFKTKQKSYLKNIAAIKKKVNSSNFAETKDRLFGVIDGLTDVDDAIFAGIYECFDLIESGHVRTGIFVLGRSIEEILTLYVEKSHEKRKRIGITKKQYSSYKEFFPLGYKLEFIAGKRVTLTKFGRRLRIQFTKPPRLNDGNKSSLHEIRKFGRNKGAHPITSVELQYAINHLDGWLTTGMNFIVDMQIEINRLV